MMLILRRRLTPFVKIKILGATRFGETEKKILKKLKNLLGAFFRSWNEIGFFFRNRGSP